MTTQKFRGLFGCFNSKNIYDLNHAWYALGREWPWIAGSQGEPLIGDFSGIVTEGFTIPETVF